MQNLIVGKGQKLKHVDFYFLWFFLLKTLFTKGKKRKKPDKDLNAPKAPLTGYVRFLNEHREKVRAENQDLPFHEVTKILGNMWSQLPSQQKQVAIASSIQISFNIYQKNSTTIYLLTFPEIVKSARFLSSEYPIFHVLLTSKPFLRCWNISNDFKCLIKMFNFSKEHTQVHAHVEDS